MHDPRGKRYAAYYCTVLVVVTAVVIFMTLQVIHQGPLQSIMTFFEGFFSLFMLGRNETVGKALLAHLSGIATFLRRG